MTNSLLTSRAVIVRPSLSVKNSVGIPPDICLRVPPTGIPKPDQEESPLGLLQALRCIFSKAQPGSNAQPGSKAWTGSNAQPGRRNWRRAGGRMAGALIMALAMLAGANPATASVDTGIGLQIGIGVGNGSGITPGIGGGEASGKPLRQMPDDDWVAKPLQVSQASGQVTIPKPAAVIQAPTVLPDRIRQAILLDLRVAEMSARACQMAHRVGIARAEGRPKVTATVTGSRQIASRIKKAPRYGLVQRNGRVVNIPKPHYVKEIEETGANTREFDHREKNNIYDGKISVRHTIIDWGQRGSRKEARELGWQAAQIDARVMMRERSHDLVQLALTLRRSDEIIAALKASSEAVAVETAAVRARVEAGAGRLSDLREAQLVQLDQEIAINRAEAERDILLEHLETEFDLSAEDAWMLSQAFLASRSSELAALPAGNSDRAHAIRLRARGLEFEADEIRASRYPKFDAVIDGTIFDLTDYEDEYEVVGKIEMSVPLYDGGTAKARLRETAWRENELKSSLEALLWSHERETEGLAKRFNQMTREESEALARRDELAAQLRSVRERQGKTVNSPLAVARLLAQIGSVEASIAELRFDRELLQARALLIAEQIDSVLGLSMEDATC